MAKKVLKDLVTLMDEDVVKWFGLPNGYAGGYSLVTQKKDGRKVVFGEKIIRECAGMDWPQVVVWLQSEYGSDSDDLNSWYDVLHKDFWTTVPDNSCTEAIQQTNDMFHSHKYMTEAMNRPKSNSVDNNPKPKETEGDRMMEFFATPSKDWSGDPQW